MPDDLDPTTFTDREKEIAREGYRRGYQAAEKFWKQKTAVARNHLRDALEELDRRQQP